jgi:hypothetical protein
MCFYSIRQFRQNILSDLHKIQKGLSHETGKTAKKEKGTCKKQLLVVV